MPTISLVIKEAKIVNSEYSKPERKFNERSGAFKCLNFNIVPTISVKNSNVESGWDNKMFAIRCTIWSERLAEKFLAGFDMGQKNYITVLAGHLNNFHVDEICKTSNSGRDYNVNAYSYFSMTVNDFVITTKPPSPEPSHDTAYAKTETRAVNEVIDDEVPFSF